MQWRLPLCGGVGTISYESIDPAPAFMPLAKNPYRSDKLGNMGKLTGLLKCSVFRGDNGDRPDFAFLLPLAHQVGKGFDTVLGECRDKPLQEYKFCVWSSSRRIKRSEEVDHGDRTHLAFSYRDDESFRVRNRPLKRHGASFRLWLSPGNIRIAAGAGF